jgi:hypothetical protein
MAQLMTAAWHSDVLSDPFGVQALAALEDGNGLVVQQVEDNCEWQLDQLQQSLQGQREVQVRMPAVVE